MKKIATISKTIQKVYEAAKPSQSWDAIQYTDLFLASKNPYEDIQRISYLSSMSSSVEDLYDEFAKKLIDQMVDVVSGNNWSDFQKFMVVVGDNISVSTYNRDQQLFYNQSEMKNIKSMLIESFGNNEITIVIDRSGKLMRKP